MGVHHGDWVEISEKSYSTPSPQAGRVLHLFSETSVLFALTIYI